MTYLVSQARYTFCGSGSGLQDYNLLSVKSVINRYWPDSEQSKGGRRV